MLSKKFINKIVAVLTLHLFCFTTMLFGPVSMAVAGEWLQVTTQNTPDNFSRAGIAQNPTGTFIYLVGGINSVGGRYSTTITRYVTTNNTYEHLGDLPIGLERPHVIYYNNYLYIIGGAFDNGTTNGGKNTTVYKFDLYYRTCTTLGEAPRAPYYSGMAVQGTTAYFYGGQTVEGMMKYELPTDTWTELSRGPRGLDQLWFSTGFATSDGKVHYYGGRHTPTGTYFNDVVSYDPATENYSTTEIPAYGDTRYYAKAFVAGSKVVIAGGTNGSQALSQVISFDYNTKTWNNEADLPFASASHMIATYNDNGLMFENGQLYGLSLATSSPGNGSWRLVESVNQPSNSRFSGYAQDGNQFYLVGGQDRFGGRYLNDVYSYDPSSRSFNQLPDLPVGLESVNAHIKDGYLYVFGGLSRTGYSKNVYRLPLSGGSWEDLGTADQFYSSPGSVVQGEYAYFFGGSNSGEALLRYKFSSNTWTNMGANPRGLSSLTNSSGFTTPDGKIHFYAGTSPGTPPSNPATLYNNVVSYDPDQGTFSMDIIEPFGTPKRSVKNAQLGSKIYFTGGMLGGGVEARIDEVVSYDINTGTWADEPSLPVPGSTNVMAYGGSLLAFREGTIYEFNPDGSGSSILEATISGQSAAYFSPSEISPTQVTLNGTDGLTAIYTTTPWNVTDARGTGAGWYATMSATTPTSSNGKTIPLANLKLTVSNVNKATDALTSSNPAMLQYANGVTLENPNTVLASPANQGMGSFKFTPGLELSIPASSYAGQYSSTITASFYEVAPVI